MQKHSLKIQGNNKMLWAIFSVFSQRCKKPHSKKHSYKRAPLIGRLSQRNKTSVVKKQFPQFVELKRYISYSNPIWIIRYCCKDVTRIISLCAKKMCLQASRDQRQSQKWNFSISIPSFTANIMKLTLVLIQTSKIYPASASVPKIQFC